MKQLEAILTLAHREADRHAQTAALMRALAEAALKLQTEARKLRRENQRLRAQLKGEIEDSAAIPAPRERAPSVQELIGELSSAIDRELGPDESATAYSFQGSELDQ